MVDPCGLNVVDRPFSWRSTTAPQIGTSSLVSCQQAVRPALYPRGIWKIAPPQNPRVALTLLYLTILCYILLYFAISCYILSKGGSHANKPFKPTAGKTPPTIIGREDVLEEFSEGLTNGPGAPGRLMRIAGVRGTGKTVLLDECSRLAQSRGWTVIKEVATEGLCQRILEQLQPKFQAKHARFEPTVAGISIGSIDIERIGPSLRDAMRQTISKNGNGLLITLDEVQDAELDEVRTLSIAIQQVIGEDLDIAFVFAGLPSMIESIINGKTLTFLRRALPFDLKAVAVTEVSYSLEETIEASGMELQPGIAGQLAR